MAKPHALYELILIIRQDAPLSLVEDLQAQYKEIIEQSSAEVAAQEYCGLLTLAYVIGSNKRCHYVLMDIKGPAGCLKELQRRLSLSTDVVRFMVMRVKAFGTRPSVLARASSEWSASKVSDSRLTLKKPVAKSFSPSTESSQPL